MKGGGRGTARLGGYIHEHQIGGGAVPIRVLTRFVLKYTLRAAHLELGGVEREVRRSGKP